MKKIFLCDMHVHSKYSFDGCEAVYDLCVNAKDKGMNTIAVTDHFDCFSGMNEPEAINNFTKMFNDVSRLKEDMKNDIQILKGIELGEALDNLSCANHILNKFNFDFILLSLHNLTNKPDFYYIKDFSEENVYNLLEEYFNEIIELVDFENFDSLAHLTYPFRYIIPKVDFEFNIIKFNKQIDEILSKLAEKNKALEINSSGLRQQIKDTLPEKNIVKRFKYLGGKYITIGSDAHRCEDIGKDIEKAMLTAYEAGFDSVTIFKSHNPILYKINL